MWHLDPDMRGAKHYHYDLCFLNKISITNLTCHVTNCHLPQLISANYLEINYILLNLELEYYMNKLLK